MTELDPRMLAILRFLASGASGPVSPDEMQQVGLLQQGNIDLLHRPTVPNPDGSYSTVRSFSIGAPQGEVLLPQVVGNQVVPIPQAIQHYQQTGQNLGTFTSPAAADRFAQMLHELQARKYAPPARQYAPPTNAGARRKFF